MPLLRETLPVGALGCNCTVVMCGETREAIVVDPGAGAGIGVLPPVAIDTRAPVLAPGADPDDTGPRSGNDDWVRAR